MKRTKQMRFGAWLLSSAFAATAAHADGAVAGATPGGSEIVVTATRSARLIKDVPMSASVIDADRIAQTPAKTLDDIVRRIPSVELPIAASYQLHPTANSISMRGLGGIRALVLLDGVPLNDPFFGYIQWSQVPIETVDRVEVVRGGGATLWGNYAMGGVINILTRAADRDALMAEAAGGSYGTWRGGFHGAYLVSDGLALGLDGGVSHTDGFNQIPAALRGPANAPTSFTATDIAGTADADLTADLSARMRVSYFDKDQRLLFRLGTNRQRTWRYTGSLTQRLGSNGALELTLFHHDSVFTTDNVGNPDGAPPNTVTFVQNRHRTPVKDFGTSLVWSQRFGGLLKELSAGIDYHGIRGRDVADILDRAGVEVRTDIGGGQQRFIGGFVQASLRPVDPLELLLSVRYQDFYNHAGFDFSPGGPGPVPGRHDSDVDPRLSVRYSISSSVSLRAAAYRAFRAPTLDNLYRAFSIPGGIFLGNPDLRPETLEGAEIGFDVERPGLRIQVTGFANRLKNALTFSPLVAGELPTGFFFGSRIVNAARARSRGLEAEANWTAGRRLNGYLTYGFVDSEVTANAFDPASIGKQQPGIPRHKITAGLTWSGPWGLRLTPQMRYLSRSNGDSSGQLKVDEHFIVDLAASLPVTRGVEAFAQVENLFDANYIADNSGFNPPLRGTPLTALAGIRLTLE
jgi:outer membrane receptor protein involved in Fe transport